MIGTIDLNFLGLPHTIASYVLESSDGLVLVEVGPSTCHQALVAGLAEMGATTADVRHVLLTHIHLDHAGAAGWWGQQGARVYVHERGARHLIDPTHLIASAKMIYKEMMDVLWGEILPIPADKLTVLHDNDVLKIGELQIEAWDTPGHARHHLAYVVEDVALTGDVTGVRLSDHIFTGLAGAPPQFDVEAYMGSLDRLEAARFRAIYPTHFGRIDDVMDHLQRYRAIVNSSAALVQAHMQNGADREALVRAFTLFQQERAMRQMLPDAIWQLHEATNKSAMSADGVALYWQKRIKKM